MKEREKGVKYQYEGITFRRVDKSPEKKKDKKCEECIWKYLAKTEDIKEDL